MSQIKVSVVVPVYNVERYLDECVASILASSLQEIEVLLVDDGAKDSSGKLCDKWAKKDSRVRVFHKKNGGLSDARNHGLAHVQGEYIAFVDSDDKIHCDMLKKLYDACVKYHALVSICDVFLWYPNSDRKDGRVADLPHSGIMTPVDYAAVAGMYHNTAWRKLYHRSLFDGKVEFPFGIYHEDIGPWWQIMAQIDAIAIVNEALYYYRQDNMSSICQVRDECRHSSDTILSFKYGLFGGLKLVSKSDRQKYMQDFLRKYLVMVWPENITKQAKKAHFEILKALKSAALQSDEDTKNKYLSMCFVGQHSPIVSIRLFRSWSKTYIRFFIRLFGIKLFEFGIGK